MFWKRVPKEISGKCLTFFGPTTTKWRPCKIFTKLNGNHLLMANIFKLHNIRHFVLLKTYITDKIWFAKVNLVCEKVWFTINELSKILFFNFSKFQMIVVKNIMKNPAIFIMAFEVSCEVLLRQKYFWSPHFCQWNDNTFNFFLKCPWKWILFLYFFYLNEILQPHFWWYI